MEKALLQTLLHPVQAPTPECGDLFDVALLSAVTLATEFQCLVSSIRCRHQDSDIFI